MLLEPIHVKTTLTEILTDTLDQARQDGSLSLDQLPVIQLDVPKDSRFGDIATNLAMVLAGPLKQSPRKIASILVEHIPKSNGLIDRCEIAGPGFINFFLKDDYWRKTLQEIQERGEDYGRSARGEGASVLLEFVSANPTGPLHIGHGRGAVVGDALARILDAAGYKVTREFYINDAGRQLRVLGRSVWLRYRRLFDPAVPFPDEDVYPGDYVIGIAERIRENEGDRCLSQPEEEVIRRFADLAAKEILEGINGDLQKIGVRFDHFFSERSLYAGGKVQECIEGLDAK